jgi:hypothetical protein
MLFPPAYDKECRFYASKYQRRQFLIAVVRWYSINALVVLDATSAAADAQL